MRRSTVCCCRGVRWKWKKKKKHYDRSCGTTCGCASAGRIMPRPVVAELMEHVEATGSLSKGCKCMQMAYSKGWKILKRAEEDLGIPLVQGNRGGSNGGQTVLTPEGKEFLKRYRKFEQEVRAGADASFQKWFGTEEK